MIGQDVDSVPLITQIEFEEFVNVEQRTYPDGHSNPLGSVGL